MSNKKPLYAINFHYLRNLLKITCNEMAERISIPYSTYRAYEEGRSFPRWDKLLKICEVLQYTDIYRMLTEDLSKEQKNGLIKVSNQEAIESLNRVKIFLSEMSERGAVDQLPG